MTTKEQQEYMRGIKNQDDRRLLRKEWGKMETMSYLCKHQWLQKHEEFIPHPFYYLIRCLQCNRIIIDKSNPKNQSSASTANKEVE